MKDFDTCTKIAWNVDDLGKLTVTTGFEKLPKVEKSPNLVTLVLTKFQSLFVIPQQKWPYLN